MKTGNGAMPASRLKEMLLAKRSTYESIVQGSRAQYVIYEARRILGEINAAIARIDADRGGLCTCCKAQIDTTILAHIPWARLCYTCNAKALHRRCDKDATREGADDDTATS